MKDPFIAILTLGRHSASAGLLSQITSRDIPGLLCLKSISSQERFGATAVLEPHALPGWWSPLIVKDLQLKSCDISKVKKENCQPSKWATSDTTTGLLSEEWALEMSMVGSQDGPSWGTAAAGWPSEATKNRKSLVRRTPVTATPLTALVATLEELLALEPRSGALHRSMAWKHLKNWVKQANVIKNGLRPQWIYVPHALWTHFPSCFFGYWCWKKQI